LLLIGCSRGDAPAPDRGPATPLDPAETGAIAGTVRFDGPVPPETILHLAGDPASLGRSEVGAGDVRVSAGRVQNAFEISATVRAGQTTELSFRY
jgi:hypothetical protein